MRYDFNSLSRSSVGFERLFNMLDNAMRLDRADGWPPYDIIRTGENSYRIVMAVAGFAPEELTVTAEANLLVVTGQKVRSGEAVHHLHRGIGDRDVRRSFELADYVKVTRANLENGLLTIDLEREVPEDMMPRRIDIKSGASIDQDNVQQIEGSRAA